MKKNQLPRINELELSKSILIIGSNSFSGSHFAYEALRQGFRVWGTSRSKESNDRFLAYKWEESYSDRFRFQQLDLNTELDQLICLIEHVRPSYIVNFAGQGMVSQSWEHPLDWYQTNLLSQVALHEHLRKANYLEKYIHFTTPEVYGSSNGQLIREGSPFNPTTPYAVSRAACDMHLDTFFRAYEFPVIFTRAANVYGAGQQPYRIIPRTILSARTGKGMLLHGGGGSQRSFIHISDVSRALLLLCMHGQPGTTWHLSTQEWISIRSLVERVCGICGVDMNSFCNVSEETLGKDQEYRLDSSKIRKTHGWKDAVSLDEGLEEVVNWVDSNLSFLCSQEWNYVHKK